MQKVSWGLKVISRTAPMPLDISGYGGWLKTSRGWETWNIVYGGLDFPFTDLNTIYDYRSKYCVDTDQYFYLIEEIDETEYNRLFPPSIGVSGCVGPKLYDTNIGMVGITGTTMPIDMFVGKGGAGGGGLDGYSYTTHYYNDEEFRQRIIQSFNKYVNTYDLPTWKDGQALTQDTIRQITREEINNTLSNIINEK